MPMTGLVSADGTYVRRTVIAMTTPGRAILQRFVSSPQPQAARAASAAAAALLAPRGSIDGESEGGTRLTYETARGRKAVRGAVEACLKHAAELMRPHNFVPGGGPPLATDEHGAEVHFCDAAARQWNVAGFVARAAFFTGSVVYREALAELDAAIGEHGAPDNSRSAARLVLIAAEPDAPPPEPVGGLRSGLAQLQLLAA